MDLLKNQSPVRKKKKSWNLYTILFFITVSLFLSAHFRSLRNAESERQVQADTSLQKVALSPSVSSDPAEAVKLHVVRGRVRKIRLFTT